MFASVFSAAISGMEVHLIKVEADVSDGLPSFTMVGLPSLQVKEAQDRVRTALKNNGIALPPKRITVNLAPADIRKEGAGFDLPLAAAVLAAAGVLSAAQLGNVMMAGEIGLSGEIRPVNLIEQRIGEAEKLGFKRFLLPKYNLQGIDTQKLKIELVPVRKVEEAFRALFG